MDTIHSEWTPAVNKQYGWSVSWTAHCFQMLKWYPFELWELLLVFLIFYLQGRLNFLLCGADRNRISLNYMGTKIFVSHRFTFCHFRINVDIVPIYIYLPNLEKSKGNLSKTKAFLLAYPVPLWLLLGACLLFHLCFRRICVSTTLSLHLAPPICTCHLCVGREAGDFFTYSLASEWL